MSDDNYLKNARKNAGNVTTEHSEVELITANEGLGETFQELVAIRRKINDKKMAALKAIDDEHREELKEIEAQYAMMLSLAR